MMSDQTISSQPIQNGAGHLVNGLAEGLTKIVGDPGQMILMGYASKEIISRWCFNQNSKGILEAAKTTAGAEIRSDLAASKKKNA